MNKHSRTPAVIAGTLATALAVTGVLINAFQIGHEDFTLWPGGSLIVLGLVAAATATWLNARHHQRN